MLPTGAERICERKALLRDDGRYLSVVKSDRYGNRLLYALEDEHLRNLLVLTVNHLQHQRTGE